MNWAKMHFTTKMGHTIVPKTTLTILVNIALNVTNSLRVKSSLLWETPSILTALHVAIASELKERNFAVEYTRLSYCHYIMLPKVVSIAPTSCHYYKFCIFC